MGLSPKLKCNQTLFWLAPSPKTGLDPTQPTQPQPNTRFVARQVCGFLYLVTARNATSPGSHACLVWTTSSVASRGDASLIKKKKENQISPTKGEGIGPWGLAGPSRPSRSSRTRNLPLVYPLARESQIRDCCAPAASFSAARLVVLLPSLAAPRVARVSAVLPQRR